MTTTITVTPKLKKIIENIPVIKTYLEWDNGRGRFYGEKSVNVLEYELDYYVDAYGSCMEVLRLTHDSQAEFKSCAKASISNIVLWDEDAIEIPLSYEEKTLLAKEIKSRMILI